MLRIILSISATFLFLIVSTCHSAELPHELRVGIANHAFDHLGGISEQAEAAAASGANIIYATGLGSDGYSGLPARETLTQRRQAAAAYVRRAKSHGIRLVLGYLCATSVVKLESFDQHWTQEFRSQFQTPPAQWRQQDREGKPLPSWYGGDYQPACLNNPDWRRYEKFMVRQQLETGHDGIFFDNPTVHPQGCYCPHCMEQFAGFLKREGATVPDRSLEALRQLACQRTNDFMRFRSTIARDFLAEMRTCARQVNRHALITCNNSLNSADALYSQCRSYAYNISELSRAEDFVVVEDMSSQPRVLANGKTIEYTPTYKQLHAISHGRPVVAVAIAEADYHTPPNLVRLAMAEAAANNASYLSWPTWPENQRQRMIAAIRPQADLLRVNERRLNSTQARRDAVLFLPFRRWIETNTCAASGLAAALTRANVQYEVLSEENFTTAELKQTRLLIVESPSVLALEEQAVVATFKRNGGHVITADQPTWLTEVEQANDKPSVSLRGPPTLRAIVRDQPGRTMVHLLNLNIQRLSSFEDKVTPATDVNLTCRVPFKRVRSVRALTADAAATVGLLNSTTRRDGRDTLVEITIPRLEIATIVVIER